MTDLPQRIDEGRHALCVRRCAMSADRRGDRVRSSRGRGSVCRDAAPAAGLHAGARSDTRAVLRVCADPNNLPFSNGRGEGSRTGWRSSSRRDLHATVEYTWWAQRRGFVRKTLSAGACDVVDGSTGRRSTWC